jgi:hypothetical protein
MSKFPRVLIVAATLAAMNLVGMTTVAHAQATNKPTGRQAGRRPPTQGQVGEVWHQPPSTPNTPNVAGDTRRPPTESQVGEAWRHQTNVPARLTEPSRQPSWRPASLRLLISVLALAAGLAVLDVRRTGRRARVGQAT